MTKAPQGLSPFAVVCLVAGLYQLACLKLPDFLGLSLYAFPLAALTGPLAWREIGASRGRVSGRPLVVIGLGAAGTVLILKFFMVL